MNKRISRNGWICRVFKTQIQNLNLSCVGFPWKLYDLSINSRIYMSFSWKISGISTAYFSNFQDFLKKSIVGFSRKIMMTC
jgi:hypothetical protein